MRQLTLSHSSADHEAAVYDFQTHFLVFGTLLSIGACCLAAVQNRH